MMNEKINRILGGGLLTMATCFVLAAVPATAGAIEKYPARALTIISPFPPGGGNDGVARLLAHELGGITGQSVVVENRSGAGGNLGTSQVARAKADGYTLVLSQNSVMAVNPALYSNTGFDAITDFRPISQITSAPLAFVVPASSPYNTLNSFLEAARKDPGGLTYATPGNGTLSHLAGTLLAHKGKVSLVHIPYRGAGPAINDLQGGTVDMLVTSPPSVEGLVAAGKLRVLAMTHENRIGVFKDAPTLAELGIDGISIEGWYGLFVPAGTPADRVAYLASAVQKALKSQDLIEKINNDGAQAIGSSPEQLAAKLREESLYWADVVATAKLKIN